MAKIKPPKIKRKRLTLVGLNTDVASGTLRFRNPTAAITARGGLIAKTRKPG